ncbi:ketosynthase chain-length factor [Streptomyces xiamenensis]
MNRRAVVTGMGIMAPNGLGTRAYWEATCAGTSGIRRLTAFDPSRYPARLAGEIRGIRVADHLSGRLIPQTDRVTQLSLIAADWALRDSGLGVQELGAYDVGVMTASSAGGFAFAQHELGNLWARGGRYVSAYQSFAWFYAVNTGQISIRHGARGPGGVVVSEQAGGLDAVARARRAIREGTPVMVAGALDALFCPWGWVGLHSSGRLSTADDPAAAYLPFDPRARGHVPGEGGAMLIVESAETAAARGARARGEIAGYGATFGPFAPALRRAMELALADARMPPAEVDVVFADGAALPGPDRAEAEALGEVFGPYGVPVTVPKTMTGRLYAGAASLDLATALLAMEAGLIPPTVHTEPDDDFRLDLVRARARPARPRTAMVVARGHGGFNSVVVLRAPAAD